MSTIAKYMINKINSNPELQTKIEQAQNIDAVYHIEDELVQHDLEYQKQKGFIWIFALVGAILLAVLGRLYIIPMS